MPIKGGGAALKGLQYRIQVSPMDCTGCDLCTHACPDQCLTATPLAQCSEVESANWDFYRSLPSR